jgi:hypothetical protein
VEEEDEVPLLPDSLDRKGGPVFAARQQGPVGEVVDREQLLRDAVFFDDEVVLTQPEDLVSSRVGDRGVDQDQIDLELFLELRLREQGGRDDQKEQEGDAQSSHVG